MKISIIIPTLNRLDDLKITIQSIKKQSLKPYELIIVDQSNNENIKSWFKKQELPFKKKYVYQKEKSLTKARNHGLRLVSGDIITFFDDDVTLKKNYLENLEKSFLDEKVIGVQGYITNNYNIVCKISFYLLRIYDFLFFNSSLFDTTPGIYENPYPLSKPKKIKRYKWMSGCNFSYRFDFIRKSGLLFDEKLIRYSYREDVDFTYRSYKKIKDEQSLILNPDMVLDHRISKQARIGDVNKIKMRYTYFFYLYFKNMDKGLIVLIWSTTGFIIRTTIISLVTLSFKNVLYELNGLFFSFKRIKLIKRGRIQYINKEIFG